MPALGTSTRIAPQPIAAGAFSREALLRYAVIPLAATGLMALCAHISVPTPFTPVPTTMQNFGVLLIALLLGPVRGAIALSLYLLEGALGLPVFSPHGLGGVAQLAGPTGGYLLSYPFAALLTGGLAAKLRTHSILALGTAALTGELVIFAAGTARLMTLLQLRPAVALHLAVLPFLAAEGLKLVFLVAVVSALRRVQRSL